MAMKTMNYIRTAMLIGWRAIQVFVVIPCSLVGGVVVFGVAIGEAPVTQSILAVYQWAEVAIRPAPPGTILETECISKKPGVAPTAPILPESCDATETKAVPVIEAAERTSKLLFGVYLALVAVSAAVLVVVVPVRQLFVRHEIVPDSV